MELLVHGRRKFKTIEEKRLYSTWATMKQRCNNPKNPSYEFYGARGISVCTDWKSFDKFFTDMGSSYSLGLTLDRIDNKLGYDKQNCRWVSWEQQQNNRMNNRRFTYNDLTMTLTEWAKVLNIKRSTLAQRIYVYKWPTNKALTTQPRKRG